MRILTIKNKMGKESTLLFAELTVALEYGALDVLAGTMEGNVAALSLDSPLGATTVEFEALEITIFGYPSTEDSHPHPCPNPIVPVALSARI